VVHAKPTSVPVGRRVPIRVIPATIPVSILVNLLVKNLPVSLLVNLPVKNLPVPIHAGKRVMHVNINFFLFSEYHVNERLPVYTNSLNY
jgi:hypothetical protein